MTEQEQHLEEVKKTIPDPAPPLPPKEDAPDAPPAGPTQGSTPPTPPTVRQMLETDLNQLEAQKANAELRLSRLKAEEVAILEGVNKLDGALQYARALLQALPPEKTEA